MDRDENFVPRDYRGLGRSLPMSQKYPTYEEIQAERSNRSWANESPYRIVSSEFTVPVDTEFDRSYFLDYGVSVSPESAEALRAMRVETEFKSALEEQVSGNHYKEGGIQPIEFITKNNLSFIIGNVIKYAYRADKKGGADDLFKCIHYLRIELETKYGVRSEIRYDKE